MSMHLHHLTGCAPAPLAHYLKALGILRLVSEQADKHVRGWWQDEHFCLLTSLDREELEAFFLTQYQPTPVFNPWGGRSGYYSEGSEKTARLALCTIEESKIDRLSGFREAISTIRLAITNNGGSKPDSEESKASLIAAIQQTLRGAGSDWLATVLADLGYAFRGPAIMGTGGNEGSGSYTAAFLAAVIECTVRGAWNKSLPSCLFGASAGCPASWDGSFSYPNPKNLNRLQKTVVDQPFRQFLPEGTASPWDLLFTFEGAILMRSGVTQRSATQTNRFVSSPFYFAPHGIGAASSCDTDEFVLNKGRKTPGRGEQWFPMWQTPATYMEVSSLLAEGRCTIGRRRAGNPLDAARAISQLGINRGITCFLRYGYLQRNNLATHFAVPLGRICVRHRPQSHLIDDLAPWMDRLQRLARDKHAPARLVHAERRLADAVFASLTHDDNPERWQAVLLAAVAVEAIQAAGTAIDAGPIPPLSPEWVKAVDDNSSEFRCALSLGSAAAGYSREGRPFDSVRHHWLPLEKGARQFKVFEKRLAKDSRVVMNGRDAVADCAAIVERRLIEAEKHSQRRLPIIAARGCSANLSDLACLLSGTVDLSRVVDLGRAFMALRWDQWSSEDEPQTSRARLFPEEAWLALRLACLPWPLDNGRNVPADPGIIRRLLSGDGAGAVTIALSRLRAAGLRVPLQAAVTDPHTARLWAAALVFPINRASARRAAAILDPNFNGDRND